MNTVYITSIGAYLPGPPIANDAMEQYLGFIHNTPSRLKDRILKQNGIQFRHYAIDTQQQTLESNAEMASKAVLRALEGSTLRPEQVDLLAAGTTQGDLPVPGFASMVHARLPFKSCAVSSFQSVCASGVMALQNAALHIAAQKTKNAVVVGSELSSRLFKGSRFTAQKINAVPFDTEFLRWMLSDGAGAMVLQDTPRAQGISLKLEWVDIRSHAHHYPVVMYTGKNDNQNENEPTWLDYPSYEEASANGAINLKQDVRLLDQVIKEGIVHYFDLINKGLFTTDTIDILCCHYSSEMFKPKIKELLEKGGAYIPEEKWFSNLKTKGNTGSASIFIMLEELFNSGKLVAGQRILCMVPESGRFITSFFMLEVVNPTGALPASGFNIRPIEAPELKLESNSTSEWLIRALSSVWIQFETALLQLPVIQKIHAGNLSKDDYKLLLNDLRQQVIDGSQWISRAASNIDIELFELRSAFIKHTAAEHRDYQILEANWVAMGWDKNAIQNGIKNIGSQALSAYMFHQASKPNPVNLMGSMFIIEGIGKRLAAFWGEMIKTQLQLNEDQVSFFTYHGVADENHFHNLEKALNHPLMNMDIADQIVKTAKTTAALYVMQLKELGNY